MDFKDAIILGTVQGLTEFLPVSSSGHLVIAQHLIEGFEQPGVLFDVILHFGTLLATLLYFWKDIVKVVSGFVFGGREQKKSGWILLAGSVPTGVIGITFKDTFEQLFHSVTAVAFMLILTGTFLFLSGKKKNNHRKEITLIDSLIIGTAQGIAIIPGISRSGLTISTGIFRNIDSETVGRFSFLLSLPAIVGAVILQARHLQQLETHSLFQYIAGALAAMIVGLVCIKVLMTLLRSRKFSLFAYYCWFAGFAVLAFF